jgi:predicted MFS family arabinose efflux permease
MVARGFLAQNFADSLAFGSFGISVLAVEAHYSTSRAVASLGISFVLVAMGLLAPFLAAIIDRLTIRRTMYLGLSIAAVGYLTLAFAPNIQVYLAAYLFLVGPGAVLMGAFPSSILVANWFAASGKVGQVVGIVNMPLFMMLIPVLCIGLLQHYELRGLFLAVAAAHVVMLPVIKGVIDRPPAAHDRPASAAPLPVPLSRRQILRRPAFWILAIGCGLPNATGPAALAHIMAIAVERGHPIAEASLLPMVMGIAGIFGAVSIGTLCDKIGAARTLSLMGVCMALGWTALLFVTSIPGMASAWFVIGSCTGGAFSAQSALGRQLFGIDNLPRLLGLTGLFGLPLLFALPPLCGYIRDLSGTYDLTIITLAAIACLVALVFVMLQLRTGAQLRASDRHNGPHFSGEIHGKAS